MAEQPRGIVTFLFTDIEGSTRLLQELGRDRYAQALGLHRRLLREAFERHDGYEVDYEGDAFFVAFQNAEQALAAAAEAQQALAEADWPDEKPIRVRIGLHTGEPLLDPPKYVGLDIHRAARIMAAAHGGQVLLSRATRQLVDSSFAFRDLGEHRLKDLLEPERLYQLGDASFPPPRTLYRASLPIQPTPFLGRERELAEVLALLSETRLLTLTGAGGSGKTRLALQAAAESAEQLVDGVWWVSLGALREPGLVLETIAQTLEAKVSLAEHIADKQLLLLLDNFEQLLDAAPALAELLTLCPNLRVLVTSREPVHVRAEREYSVPPFPQEEAVGFFLARARAVSPEFEQGEEVAEICARLDNLPLALELAAARAKTLTAAEILSQLAQRLPFLTGGYRDLPLRQQTLADTIAWSYELLGPAEQQAFRRLALFAGGCTVEAAEQVAGADLEMLQSLVEKSLLRFADDRYSMLETIGEFALARLEESEEAEAIAAAHAHFFVDWGAQVGPLLRGSTQAEWLPRVDAEHDNLREALARSFDAEPPEALRLAAALRRYWWLRSLVQEGRTWFERLLPLARASPSEAALWVISGTGAMAREQGDFAAATALAEEALQLALGLDEPELIAAMQHELALILEISGADRGRATSLYEEALARRRELGDLVGVVQELNGLSFLAFDAGDIERARARLREALEIAHELGDKESRAGTLTNLATFSLQEDASEEELAWARDALAESLTLSYELGNPAWIANALEALAAAEARFASNVTAVHLLGAAAKVRDTFGIPIDPADQSRLERTVASLRSAVERAEYERLWEEGRATPLERLVKLAGQTELDLQV